MRGVRIIFSGEAQAHIAVSVSRDRDRRVSVFFGPPFRILCFGTVRIDHSGSTAVLTVFEAIQDRNRFVPGAGLGGWRIAGIVRGVKIIFRQFEEDTVDGSTGRTGQKTGFLADGEGYMFVTGTLGLSAADEILLVNLAASRILVTDAFNGELAGFFADGCSNDVVRLFKIFYRKILMDPVHDSVPEYFVIGMVTVTVYGGEIIIVVVAAPDRAGVIRCVAGEPDVFIIGSGSGFSCHGHVSKRDQRSGSLCHDVFHGTSQEPGVSLLQNFGRDRGTVVNEDLSVGTFDMRVKFRFDILSLVGDRSKSTGEFQVCDTVGDSSQGQRLVDIQGFAVFQSGDTKALRVLETDGRGDLGQAFDGPILMELVMASRIVV